MLTFIIGVLLPWIIVAAGCWIGYQLIRQNGRILLHLEALQQQIAPLAALAAQAQAARGSSGAAQAALPPLGIGSQAPDFELPTLSGGDVTLGAFSGRKRVLIFFNPGCGYCGQMASDLATLPVDGRDGRPMPIVISGGDREANQRLVREHGIRALVLLQRGNEVGELYRTAGTPTGYLVDEEGRIASEMAIGAQALLALARGTSLPKDAKSVGEAPARAGTGTATNNGNTDKAYKGNRSLADSHIGRTGLTAGTPAPEFRLERVDHGELSLTDYRGRRVLLVFSDPNCGPCEHLAPKLEELQRKTNALNVLMVSRGDREENRKKVAQYGISFPVVLQKHWEVSRSYAMFGTPVGYLIDEKGIVASDVAVGEEAILSAASRSLSFSSSNTPSKEDVQMA